MIIVRNNINPAPMKTGATPIGICDCCSEPLYGHDEIVTVHQGIPDQTPSPILDHRFHVSPCWPKAIKRYASVWVGRVDEEVSFQEIVERHVALRGRRASIQDEVTVMLKDWIIMRRLPHDRT